MKAKYDLEELKELVAVTLDGTGIDPASERIDTLIPDGILHQYNPKDVLKAAVSSGLMIAQCSFRDQYRANGVWMKPDAELEKYLAGYKRLSHTLCPDCLRDKYGYVG